MSIAKTTNFGQYSFHSLGNDCAQIFEILLDYIAERTNFAT